MNQKELDIAQDFKSISDDQWKELIIKDLKGKDFAETLEWKDSNSLTFQPYYRASDFNKIKHPERFRFLPKEWVIQQNFSGKQATNANLLDSLSKGANGLGVVIDTDSNLSTLFKEIYLDAISLNLYGNVSKATLVQLDQVIAEKGISADSINGMIGFSPLTQAAGKGAQVSMEELANCIQSHGAEYSNLKFIHIDARIVKNAGGNESQEIAFALAQVNEYIDQLTTLGLEVSTVINKMAFSFSFGTSYFIEIAKVRSFRFLFSSLCQQYDLQIEPTIYSETASIMYSGNDPYTNLLRATTASMSAVIGGCNHLVVLPHDTALKESSEFAQRIARNIQIVVKEEGHLAKVTDAGAGSYYIEQLSDELSQTAWEVFQKIESLDGYVGALKVNYIQQEIQKNKEAIQDALGNNSKVMIGINRFQPENGSNQSIVEEKEIVGTEFSALNEVRWATPFEK